MLWSRSPLEWGLGAVTVLLALLCGVAAAGRLATPGRHLACRAPGVVDAWVAASLGSARAGAGAAGFPVRGGRGGTGTRIRSALSAARIGRPWPHRPLLLLALALLGDRLAARAREERLLAAVCAGCAPLIAGPGGSGQYPGRDLLQRCCWRWPWRSCSVIVPPRQRSQAAPGPTPPAAPRAPPGGSSRAPAPRCLRPGPAGRQPRQRITRASSAQASANPPSRCAANACTVKDRSTQAAPCQGAASQVAVRSAGSTSR